MSTLLNFLTGNDVLTIQRKQLIRLLWIVAISSWLLTFLMPIFTLIVLTTIGIILGLIPLKKE